MPNDRSRSRRTALLLGLALILVSGLGYLLWKKSGGPGYGQPWLEFSGDHALAYVQALVDLGPRPAGSAANEKARTYIRRNLEASGWQVEEQRFTNRTPVGVVSFANLIARREPAGKGAGEHFLLASHFDTKSFNKIRFVGANDGGSSTGALMEMGRVLAAHPSLGRKVDLVFFDGEEAYREFSATDGLYGSRYFAKQMEQTKSARQYRAGILWDMMGDRDLTITLPPDSPVQLAQGVFAAADALGARSHFTYANGDILDDHSPLNASGIPTIDLIDFDYPPWHTADDTMDKLSAESLRTIGAVTAYYLSQFAFR